MFPSGKEEARTYGGIEEDVFLLFGEFEGVLEDIDRGRRLLQEKLDRRVRDDSFPILIRHKIFHILSDRGDSESILTSSFHESEEELRTVFILHDVPGFIDDEHSLLLAGSDRIPYEIEEDIHRDRSKDIIEISHREDDESFLEVDIGRTREYSSENSEDILFESIYEPLRSIHRLED